MNTAVNNRQFLKDATRAEHVATEASWMTQGHFADRAEYDAWLAAMMAVHTSHGFAAARVLGRAEWVEDEHIRHAALVADLSRNIYTSQGSPMATTSWAWGVAYCLNGSALGASVLLKSDALAPSWPRAYLAAMKGFAAQGGLKRFFDALDGQSIDRSEAARGAADVFAALVRR